MQKRYIRLFSILSLGRDANQHEKERGHSECLLYFNCHHTIVTNPYNWSFIKSCFHSKEPHLSIFFLVLNCFLIIEKLISS